VVRNLGGLRYELDRLGMSAAQQAAKVRTRGPGDQPKLVAGTDW
jgi:hypothetical protein